MGRSAPKLNGNDKEINPLEWFKFGMSAEFSWEQYEQGLVRAQTLLGMAEGSKDAQGVSLLTRYTLGTKRTLDQLIDFTGIDTRTRTVFGDRCKPLEWVPFTPDKGRSDQLLLRSPLLYAIAPLVDMVEDCGII
jgi:hypothetical protein